MIWLCSITLVVNPKDLNKDRGLTKWVLYFYLPYWFPKSSYMMVHLLTLTRAYMCARYLFRVDLTLNRAIYRPFCHFYFEKWIIGDFSPIRCWFYAYLCSEKPAETSLFELKLAESGRNPQWEWKKQYLCRRFRILHFLENHIRVDTIKIIKKCKICAHFFDFSV